MSPYLKIQIKLLITNEYYNLKVFFNNYLTINETNDGLKFINKEESIKYP
jgi:hypothetical protein